MAQNKQDKTASLQDLIKVLYEQTDLIRAKKVDHISAKVLNQTSNQILNAYKLQLSAYKLLGIKSNDSVIRGLLS